MSIAHWKLCIALAVGLLVGTTTHAANQEVVLNLHTSDITRIVKPGQEDKVYISVENRAQNRRSGRLSLLVQDFSGASPPY